jgi:medium-chain acyl-[acyl-carrier-protein] hydrolase
LQVLNLINAITMPISDLTYQVEFEVRAYEIDRHKRMSVPALARLMQEAALQNVIHLGLSVWDLEPQGISWVLMRKQLCVERLPLLGERIRIETCPSGFERLFTYRDYRVFDAAGKLIAHSASTWMLMDTRTRRLAPIPDFILSLASRMVPPAQHLPRPEGKLPAFGAADFARSFEVNWHDLDFNEHLNNTIYIRWMLDALPREVLQSGRFQQMDLLYRAEAQWQEAVRAETQALGGGAFLHRLLREQDGKELAAAQTQWRL